jgi:hypothetical protein
LALRGAAKWLTGKKFVHLLEEVLGGLLWWNRLSPGQLLALVDIIRLGKLVIHKFHLDALLLCNVVEAKCLVVVVERSLLVILFVRLLRLLEPVGSLKGDPLSENELRTLRQNELKHIILPTVIADVITRWRIIIISLEHLPWC